MFNFTGILLMTKVMILLMTKVMILLMTKVVKAVKEFFLFITKVVKNFSGS